MWNETIFRVYCHKPCVFGQKLENILGANPNSPEKSFFQQDADAKVLLMMKTKTIAEINYFGWLARRCFVAVSFRTVLFVCSCGLLFVYRFVFYYLGDSLLLFLYKIVIFFIFVYPTIISHHVCPSLCPAVSSPPPSL